MRDNVIPVIFIILLLIMGCNPTPRYQKAEGMIWNTLYHITYEGPSELKDSVIPVLEEMGKSLSIFDPGSIVSRLNVADSLEVDEKFRTVYDKSLEIYRLSKGNFDPTVSPLITAWGFGIGHKASSDTLAIDSILNFVGIEKTHRSGKMILKDDKRIQFNFSAIAKGYGCDAVGEMFKRNGVNDYMIEIGGEVVVSGRSPSGNDWRISIDTPVFDIEASHEAALVISITDKGIATSGNYRNFKIENGEKLAHTISPTSGRPFFSEILSATVVAPTCMEADALATACMASDAKMAKTILTTYKADGLFIFSDSVWMTPGFRKMVVTEQ